MNHLIDKYLITEADKKDALHMKPIIVAYAKVEKSVKSAKSDLQLNVATKLMANFFKLYKDVLPKISKPAMLKGMYSRLKQDIDKKKRQFA